MGAELGKEAGAFPAPTPDSRDSRVPVLGNEVFLGDAFKGQLRLHARAGSVGVEIG